MIKIFRVGGAPTKEAFLAYNLEKMIDSLQAHDWIIKDINHFTNKRAWDMYKQKYVETPEYIICAYKENIINEVFSDLEKVIEIVFRDDYPEDKEADLIELLEPYRKEIKNGCK